MQRYNRQLFDEVNPTFRYKIAVAECSDAMINWCSVWKECVPDEQYHIEWRATTSAFRFQTEKAATMFALKFGHL